MGLTVFACITEGGPNSWVVEVCTDLWETMDRKLVFGKYEDACIVGKRMVDKWKWMEG